MEAGKIFLPEPESAPWVSDFVEEMACFPNGTYDDCVDSTTQALNYLRQESFIADPELNRIMLGLEDSKELDKEALWAKAMRGCPMTEEEISRM